MLQILILALFPVLAGAGSPWTYDRQSKDGPDAWYIIASTCGGSSQSPIDIVSSNTTMDSSLGEFTWSNYGRTSGLRLELTNNGHSAELINTGTTITVTDGGLHHTYELEQLHFHWGAADTNGSEHTMDGTQYPLEMHLVHFNDDYSSVSDAAATNETDALAVFAFWFEISDSDNADLDTLLNMLQNVTGNNDVVNVTAFALDDIFGDAVTGSYYRYNGSLTTPGCNEVVVWTVFETTISISSNQLALFRALQDDDSNDLVDNFRPTQAHGDRTVLYYDGTDTETTTTAGVGILASTALLSLAVMMFTLV